MGVSMASIAFRCEGSERRQRILKELMEYFDGVEGLVHNFDSDGPGYAVVSPYGDMAMFLDDYPERISMQVEGYAVMAVSNDSDFAVLAVYHNGERLEQCLIGEDYDEITEMFGLGKPTLEIWRTLLQNPDELPALEAALYTQEVFVEDNLRKLSKLTGIPIFDDHLVFDMA